MLHHQPVVAASTSLLYGDDRVLHRAISHRDLFSVSSRLRVSRCFSLKTRSREGEGSPTSKEKRIGSVACFSGVCLCMSVIAREFRVLVRVCVINTHWQRWLYTGVHGEQRRRTRVARPCRFVVGHIC